MKPIVALVGQPNSGKSTLLNKISGRHVAVTSKVAGTTRDRQYTDTIWNGREFTMVDTAGLSFGSEEQVLEPLMNEQIDVALAEAQVVVFVVDAKEVQSLDEKVVKKFRTLKVPVILAANKVDSPKKAVDLGDIEKDLRKTGIKTIVPTSALTGLGIGDLLDEVVKSFPAEETEDGSLELVGTRISLLGKPNVGKSSLFNAILGYERTIVSPVPGTTRAAIFTPFELDGEDFVLIDTAGLKKRQREQSQPDVFSSFQTFKAVRESDVVLFLVDATEEITFQDKRLAGLVTEMDKAGVVVITKSDLFVGDERKLENYVSYHLPNLKTCPKFLVSNKTGEGIPEMLKSIKPLIAARSRLATEEELDQILKDVIAHHPPIRQRDEKEPKIYSLEQIGVKPVRFLLTVNRPSAIAEAFRNRLINELVDRLDLRGSPVKLTLKKKLSGTTDEGNLVPKLNYD